jgi:neutral ceramidase
MGPKCIDTGLPCQFETSTCNGRTEKCIAFGPGKDMYQSNEIIGQRQFETAKGLFDNAQLFLNGNGSVNFRHTYVDLQVKSYFHFFF